ncbi:MAG TPA: primosomal protein N' [Bacteroidia bacterium]|nr:primosomal protein N' [Bacteroidia bacterium]
MSSRVDYFADVILPLALPNAYTYRIPQSLNGEVKEGMRVVVQFGKNKLYSAIVRKVHTVAPSYTAKYIDSVLDPVPVVTETQLKFWDWMADYYLCTRGEVMLAALPSGLRLSSETRVVLNPGWPGDRKLTDDEAFTVCEALDVRKTLSLEDISAILDRKTVYPKIRQMLDEGIILVYEELQERFSPKFETFLALAPEYEEEEKLREVFDKLEKKAFKQLQVMMSFVHLSGRFEKKTVPVRQSDLVKASGADSSAIASLVKKGILLREELEVSRIIKDISGEKEVVLSEHQRKAMEDISAPFREKDVALLHGVTSSGKTEVYMHLIRGLFASGKQVLYLLPEIALTTQLITRLQRHFGNKVLVYHSRFNENERVEVWREVLKGEPVVVIGARSALFLPFTALGFVIIDEEHDPSFKQHDPAPRYNARESGILLATLHGAKVLLGSATPSLESFYNAKHGRYGYASMTERYGGSTLPEITVVDIREASRKRLMKSHFSPLLLEKTEQALKANEQIIFFQNRRGFAPSIECQSCGHIPHCVRCDVSLTYHKNSNQLRCHYCGWTTNPPQQCEACGGTELKMKGFGTEKIEEELSLIFPGVKVARMDLDTTRGKHSLQKLVNDFETHAIDILVGTQMVTKGLDFGNVALVGILQADQLMNFPDFRAYERSFQLMAQVSGRAGRREKKGEVIIQTFNPQHQVIQCVISHDYETLYHAELAERMEFHYPPFYRLVRLAVKGKDATLVDNGAFQLADNLRKHLGANILGPEYPPVSRVRDEFIKEILVKIERGTNPSGVKKIISAEMIAMKAHSDFKKLRVVADVDPN